MKEIILIKKGLNENLGSYHILNDEINNIISDYSDISKFSLLDYNIRDILEEASYYGLFDDHKVIIIDDVKYFSGKFNYEEEFNYLFNFLQKKDDITVIFLCEDVSKSKTNTKKIMELNSRIIDITNMDDDKKEEYIKNYCENNKIEVDNINYLLKNCYSNLDFAINEIDKLSNIDSKITTKIIDEYGISLIKNDKTALDFSNAVINHKASLSFDLFEQLILEETEMSSIIGLLASSYENMYMVKECLSLGMNDEEIAKALNYTNPGRVYIMKKNSKFYTLDDLKEMIIKLSEIDIKIKTGFDPVYTMKEFLLNM